MTTRRRRLPGPPPPRGRSGRFGLLPPLAMCATSVKAPQLGADVDLLPQDARELASLGRALEAREAAARVGAAARLVPARDEDTVTGREAEQLALRRLPAAAGALPQRDAYEGSSSACSTGIPAGTSCCAATSASGATGGSSESASAGSATGGVESGSSSVASGMTPAASASSSCVSACGGVVSSSAASGRASSASPATLPAGGAPST